MIFCRYVQYFPSLHLIKKCTFHSIIANRGDDESKYSTVQKLLFNLFISLAVEKLIGELVACEKHAKVQKDFNLQKFSMTLQTPML